MTIIDWTKIKDSKSLISALQKALLQIFGKEFLDLEVKKFKEYSPKGKPESLAFLQPYPIHRAVKWFMLLENLKERGYSFNLRFSAEIEEFMNLLLFTYDIDFLIKHRILELSDRQVEGALKTFDRFESLIYEILIAANYASNGFEVELPEVLDRGNVDVYARKNGTDVYCECKKLRRREEYTNISIEIMKKLYEKGLNLFVDIELNKIPRTSKGKPDIGKLVKVIEDAIDRGAKFYKDQLLKIDIRELPESIQKIHEVTVSKPETIEYMISAGYVEVFNGTLKIREPKLVVVRDPIKRERVLKQLNNALKKAHNQLSKVNDSKVRKVIYVDISEVAGKPILQLPEMIRINVGPEILEANLETLCRDWLVNHGNIDAVVLTQPRLYVDEFGNPYLLNIENKVVTSFTAPGWAIEILAIPIPQNTSPEALVNLGIEAAKRGNYRLAYIYYKKAIKMKPDLKEAYNNIGKLLIDMGRPDESLKYLDKALELNPSYTSALINKGIALARMGMLREALEYFGKAAYLEPSNEKAWYNKALVHYMLGELERAYEEVLKALDINPDYKLAQKLKEKIRGTIK